MINCVESFFKVNEDYSVQETVVDVNRPAICYPGRKVIFAHYVRPVCHKCSFKEDSSKKESKVNSCNGISDDENVGSCDKHARDKPRDAGEDVAFGLYRTGAIQLSTESVNLSLIHI